MNTGRGGGVMKVVITAMMLIVVMVMITMMVVVAMVLIQSTTAIQFDYSDIYPPTPLIPTQHTTSYPRQSHYHV